MITNHRHHFKEAVTYMKTRTNEIIPDEGKTSPSRTRWISQVAVSGNIGGTHVPDIFNISNDVWHTFDYQGRKQVYHIRDIQRPGGRGHGGGIFYSQRVRGSHGSKYNNNRHNWRGCGGYGHSGRVNYQGGYGVPGNNDYGNNSERNDNQNAI